MTDMTTVDEHPRSEPPNRLALELGDFTDADVAALEKVRAPDSSKDFDHELESQTPGV